MEKIADLPAITKLNRSKNSLKLYRKTLLNIQNKISANPENNIAYLKTLLEIFDESNKKKYTYNWLPMQKYSFLTLNIIFMDIIPAYKICSRGENESDKLKKEIRNAIKYEQQILKFYKYYVKELRKVCYLIKDIKLFNGKLCENDPQAIVFSVVSNCICELISTNFHFNLFEELSESIVKVFIDTRTNLSIKENILKSFETLFQNDTVGKASEFLIKCLTKRIINGQFQVESIVFQSLTFISFYAIDKNLETRIKKNFTQPARKNRKTAKKMKQLERQLLETEAITNREIRAKHEKQIITDLFAFLNNYFTFFEDLLSKRKTNDFDKWHQSSFISVLEITIYICNNISDELILNWVKRLKCLSTFKYFSSNLNTVLQLTLLKTIFKLINLVDISDIYHGYIEYFFNTIMKFQFTGEDNSKENFHIYFECIDIMFIKNIQFFPNIYFERFICRLLLMSLEYDTCEAMALLFIVKKCLTIRFGVNNVFDADSDEEEFGNAAFNILNETGENVATIINIKTKIGITTDSIMTHKFFNPYLKFFSLSQFNVKKKFRQPLDYFIFHYKLDKHNCNLLQLKYSEVLEFYQTILEMIP